MIKFYFGGGLPHIEALMVHLTNRSRLRIERNQAHMSCSSELIDMVKIFSRGLTSISSTTMLYLVKYVFLGYNFCKLFDLGVRE
jgi:hypothetical protein